LTTPDVLSRSITLCTAILPSASALAHSILTSFITFTSEPARTSTFASAIAFTASHAWARNSALASIPTLSSTFTTFGAAQVLATRTSEHTEVEASSAPAVSGLLAARSCVALVKLFTPLLGGTLLLALNFCFPGFPLAISFLRPDPQLLLTLSAIESLKARSVVQIVAVAFTITTAHLNHLDRRFRLPSHQVQRKSSVVRPANGRLVARERRALALESLKRESGRRRDV
jgi:hypothetical protein